MATHCAGMYTGHNQTKFNAKAFFQKLSTTFFNCVAFHNRTPWDNYEGFYPEPFENGKFNSKKLNMQWYDHKEAMMYEGAAHGIKQRWKLYDQYFPVHWRKYPGYAFKAHPFVENNVGVKWPEPRDTKKLYENWNRHANPGPSDFFCGIQWIVTPAGSDNVTGYKVVNAFGEAQRNYLFEFFSRAAKVQKSFPLKFNMTWIGFNEAFANYQIVDGKVKFVYGNDPDERWLQVIRLIAKEAGLKTHVKNKRGKEVRRIFEDVDFKHDLNGEIYWPETIKGFFLYAQRRGLRLECHGVGTLEQRLEFFKHTFQGKKLPEAGLVSSSDGDGRKEPQSVSEIPNYLAPQRDIYKHIDSIRNATHDYKFFVHPEWKIKDTNFNADKALQYLSKIAG